jgi:phosphatidylglycerophosphatase A
LAPITHKLILFAATGAGVGNFPLFPGTIGTLLALPVSLALNHLAALSLLAGAIVLVATIFCAIWLADKAAEILRQKDPSVIVIDEIVGFLVANFAAPNRLSAYLTAFVLFRFFDITKPFPARRLETLPGGMGIVFDDIMAGIYTVLIMHLLTTWQIL